MLRVLLTLLLVSTGTEAAAGWQLCLGAEGHVEIEWRGTCERPSPESASSDSAASPASDECDPCLDILLGVDSGDALRAARPSVLAQAVDNMSTMAGRGRSAAAETSEKRFSSPPLDVGFDAGSVSGIRTVVLLI